jgi:hypothetical protein
MPLPVHQYSELVVMHRRNRSYDNCDAGQILPGTASPAVSVQMIHFRVVL